MNRGSLDPAAAIPGAAKDVLCVPREALAGMPPGFMPTVMAAGGIPAWPSPDGGLLTPRGLLAWGIHLPRTPDLESGPGGKAWRQLIGYVILSSSDRIFLYRRPAKGGDPRLIGRLSLGLGGHVERSDGGDPAGPLSRLETCLRRELSEEIGWQGPCPFTPVGLLLDDSDEVGRRHVGVAFVCEVGDAEIRPSAEIIPVGWIEPDQAAELIDEMESWSRILAPHLAAILASSR